MLSRLCPVCDRPAGTTASVCEWCESELGEPTSSAFVVRDPYSASASAARPQRRRGLLAFFAVTAVAAAVLALHQYGQRTGTSQTVASSPSSSSPSASASSATPIPPSISRLQVGECINFLPYETKLNASTRFLVDCAAASARVKAVAKVAEPNAKTECPKDDLGDWVSADGGKALCFVVIPHVGDCFADFYKGDTGKYWPAVPFACDDVGVPYSLDSKSPGSDYKFSRIKLTAIVKADAECPKPDATYGKINEGLKFCLART